MDLVSIMMWNSYLGRNELEGMIVIKKICWMTKAGHCFFDMVYADESQDFVSDCRVYCVFNVHV